MFVIRSPTQPIAPPENVSTNRIGIVMSIGWLIVWRASEGSPLSLDMAGFAGGIGIMVFVLCGYGPSAVALTVEARFVKSHLSQILHSLSAIYRTDAALKARLLDLV